IHPPPSHLMPPTLVSSSRMLKEGWGSWDNPRARATRGLGRPSLDARSWDHPSHPLKRDSSLRPCLRNGASWRAGVGRVRSLDFLSILRECPALGPACRQSNLCFAERCFPHLLGCVTRTEDLSKE